MDRGGVVVLYAVGLSLKRRKVLLIFAPKCVAIVDACSRWVDVLVACSLQLNYNQMKLHVLCIKFLVTSWPGRFLFF